MDTVLVYVSDTGVEVFKDAAAAHKCFANYMDELDDDARKRFAGEIDFAAEVVGNEGDLGDGDFIRLAEVRT